MASTSPTTSSETTTRDRLAPHFARWRAAGRRVLIPYITAGHPSSAATPELLDALVQAGADIIELGVPFSDPIADGPTIQRSSQRALDQGVDLAWVLARLREFRSRHQTPIVLFTYLNPVVAYGTERFLADATEAGADGVLLTDLPVGSDPALEQLFEDAPLALVRLLAPTTSAHRIRSIAERAQGFLYYISRMGVTGARSALPPELAAEARGLHGVRRLRQELRDGRDHRAGGRGLRGRRARRRDLRWRAELRLLDGADGLRVSASRLTPRALRRTPYALRRATGDTLR